MHIKRIHEMEEKLTEIALCEINKGIKHVNTAEMGAVIDMIRDLACAEKEAREAKEMQKEEDEEKEEEKHMLRMLKEEYGMGEDESKRFYDAWRYKNGRFAPKGRGTRRGYEEPPYYHMTPEMMRDHDPEYWRDMDRDMGRMYYGGDSGGSSSGNAGGQSGSSMSGSNMGGNSGGSTRGYSDGYDEGQRRGYSEGYEQGSRDGESRGRSQGGNSRYDKARRGYEESKEKHKGNTPQDNSENMKSLEELLNSTGDVIVKDYAPKMSQSERAMAAQKFDTWSKMLKQ